MNIYIKKCVFLRLYEEGMLQMFSAAHCYFLFWVVSGLGLHLLTKAGKCSWCLNMLIIYPFKNPEIDIVALSVSPYLLNRMLNATQIPVIHTFSLQTPGSWLRRGLSKQWRTSATLRSPAESDSGRTLRTADVSTAQKWPEKLPSSPGQTERIPGSAASGMECDEMGRYPWTGWDGASKVEEAIKISAMSLSHLNGRRKYRGKKKAFMLSHCLTVNRRKPL